MDLRYYHNQTRAGKINEQRQIKLMESLVDLHDSTINQLSIAKSMRQRGSKMNQSAYRKIHNYFHNQQSFQLSDQNKSLRLQNIYLKKEHQKKNPYFFVNKSKNFRIDQEILIKQNVSLFDLKAVKKDKKNESFKDIQRKDSPPESKKKKNSLKKERPKIDNFREIEQKINFGDIQCEESGLTLSQISVGRRQYK